MLSMTIRGSFSIIQGGIACLSKRRNTGAKWASLSASPCSCRLRASVTAMFLSESIWGGTFFPHSPFQNTEPPRTARDAGSLGFTSLNQEATWTAQSTKGQICLLDVDCNSECLNRLLSVVIRELENVYIDNRITERDWILESISVPLFPYSFIP